MRRSFIEQARCLRPSRDASYIRADRTQEHILDHNLKFLNDDRQRPLRAYLWLGAFNVDTIAERLLALRTKSGTTEVIASLGKPKKIESNEWTCACVTKFADEVRSMDIHGGDSMQALQLAMVTLDAQLKHEAQRRGGTLLHFDEPFNSILEDSGMQPRPASTSPAPDAT